MSLPPSPALPRTPLLQLGLFGECAVLTGFHVVSAHTRVLASGREVFVSEHTRWNRGRTHRIPSPRTTTSVPPNQPGLFDHLPQSLDTPLPSGTTETHWGDEIEVFPGAVQLPLWRKTP